MRIDLGTAPQVRSGRYSVTDRAVQAFAVAVGDVDASLDEPERLTAHPLFMACVEWPLIRDGVPGLLFPEGGVHTGVHVSHDTVVHRCARSGDVLRTTARLVDVQPRSIGVLSTVDLSTVTDAGEPVAETRMGSLFVGATLSGPAATRTGRAECPAPVASIDVDRFDMDVANAIVYSECTGIWNPIHTDASVARLIGFDRPIMHGTAVLARCVSIVVRQAGRRLADVARIRCTFGGPVLLPSTVTVSISTSHGTDSRAFQARTSATSYAVRSGLVDFH